MCPNAELGAGLQLKRKGEEYDWDQAADYFPFLPLWFSTSHIQISSPSLSFSSLFCLFRLFSPHMWCRRDKKVG